MEKIFVVGLLLCCLFACGLSKTVKKGCNEKFKGCSIRTGRCVCGVDFGCRNPWPYANIKVCEKDLNGEYDRCLRQPCWHGKCVQVILQGKIPKRKWECACSGSGFYGKKCQFRCPPSDKDAPLPLEFPHDCIY